MIVAWFLSTPSPEGLRAMHLSEHCLSTFPSGVHVGQVWKEPACLKLVILWFVAVTNLRLLFSTPIVWEG